MEVSQYGPYVPLTFVVLFLIYAWHRRRSIVNVKKLAIASTFGVAMAIGFGLAGIETPAGRITLVDAGVLFTAMTFGPAIGALAGGAGAGTIAILIGNPILVPVIATSRAVEGLVAGYVSKGGEGFSGPILGGVLGGLFTASIMVTFSYWSLGSTEAVKTLSAVLTEVTTGVLLGVALSWPFKKRNEGLDELI
jgi:uncharacterized membrane protein